MYEYIYDRRGELIIDIYRKKRERERILEMDAAIRKAKDSINQIFDKNLHDLVRGIRNHKENESKYIAECIDEIKVELKQDNMAVKANAINKLCYVKYN